MKNSRTIGIITQTILFGVMMKSLDEVSILCALLVASTVSSASEPSPTEQISIVGQTPISPHGNEHYLMGTIQGIDSDALEQSNVMSLTDQMRNTLASVNVNDVQNNPFQPDVQYRGFTASPLLGLPQGISVYLNGTRFNEPFGDTVNWDLLPLSSIDAVTLFSGSNPIFGQNTLGGALSLTTKNGFDFSDNEISAQVGSFGQRQLNIQLAGHNENWGYYINANRYQEDGWRDGSPSDIKQFLANLSYRSPVLSADLLVATNDNRMIGNGAVPIELLNLQSPQAIYTQPDQTATQLGLVGLNLESRLSDSYSVNSNIYYRKNKIDSINGDDSDYRPCNVGTGITLCEGDDDGLETDVQGEMDVEAVTFAGFDDALLTDLTNIAPQDIDGTYNTGATDNSSHGFTLQLSRHDQFKNADNQLVVGLGLDKAKITFKSDSQFAVLHNELVSDDRSVSPIGLFDQESMVRLNTDMSHYYFYLMNTTQWHNNFSLSVAGRFNQSKIVMDDLIESGPGSLDGRHSFDRFNPAIALGYSGFNDLTLKASYSESSRTPSPAELSCADENDPCKLPNGFVSDPPLEQVVVKTLELNATLQQSNYQHSLTLFSTTGNNDIIFQQAGNKPSQGYFVNIEQTRRQGVELASVVRFENSNISTSYSLLDATFESPFVSFSPVNPQGADRQVQPGDTIPGQPRHLFKLNGEYSVNDSTNIGAEYAYSSSQYYRGDEANENQKIAGHSIVNLYLNYAVNARLALSVRVDNVFDRQYFTFGTYGEADEVLEDVYPEISSVNFVGPAKPRSVSLSANYRF